MNSCLSDHSQCDSDYLKSQNYIMTVEHYEFEQYLLQFIRTQQPLRHKRYETTNNSNELLTWL